MASLTRPTRATYVINENVTVDTTDNEDHSFSGVMFPIQCKDVLPVNHVVIKSIGVRGGLGPVTVWVTKEDYDNQTSTTATASASARPSASTSMTTRGQLQVSQRYWTKIYEKKHKKSQREYQPLDFSENPIILKPGKVRGIYIHSSIDNDSGIIYDNQQKIKTHDDNFITILPARAHVSNKPFGTRPIWGYGNPWRDRREFVGRISYGVVYDLWNPTENLRFGNSFRNLALTLFACQRRIASPLCRLPDECIFYILNMCRWDWVNDGFDGIRKFRKKMRTRSIEAEQAAAAAEERAQAATQAQVRPKSQAATCDTATVAKRMKTGDTDEEGVKRSSYNWNDHNRDVEVNIDEDGADGDDEQSDEEDFNASDVEEEDEDDVYVEEDDDDDEDFVLSDEYDDDDNHHNASDSFQYAIYDELASSGEDDQTERQRLNDEMVARRRWMMRLHLLQHWNIEGDVVYVNENDDSDGDG